MTDKQPLGAWTCHRCGERADVFEKGGKLRGFLYSRGCSCGYRDRQSYDFQALLWERTEWLPGRQPSNPPPSVRRATARQSTESPARTGAGDTAGPPAPAVGEWFRPSPDSAPGSEKVTSTRTEPTEPKPTSWRPILAVSGAVAACAGALLLAR